jgi:hypothetical protein
MVAVFVGIFYELFIVDRRIIRNIKITVPLSQALILLLVNENQRCCSIPF